MKITPRRIMQAYRAINELAKCVFPYKTTRGIHNLRKRITEEFDTVLSSERAMVSKHGGVLNGSQYSFETQKAAEDFYNEYEAFLSQEDEISLPVVDISKCLDCVRISSEAIDALEGLVNFGEE